MIADVRIIFFVYMPLGVSCLAHVLAILKLLFAYMQFEFLCISFKFVCIALASGAHTNSSVLHKIGSMMKSEQSRHI